MRWRLGRVPFDIPPALTFPAVDPETFWAESRVRRPAGVVEVRELGVSRGGAVRHVDLAGPSSGPGAHPGSRRLIARAHLQTRPAGSPAVIILHGFAVPAPLYDERFARLLSTAGAHAIRLDLPFHMRRRILGRGSGQGFFGADLALVRGSIRQSVEDAAALVAWARRQGASSVSVLGFSLGGLVALLLAAQVEVDAALAAVPLCDPAATFVECLPARTRRRIGLVGGAGGIWGSDTGTARAVLDASLAPVVARNLVPVTPGGRMTLVAAGLDGLVGVRPVHELAGLWGTDCWTYPEHGHMSVLVARGFWSRIVRRLVPAAPAVPAGVEGPLATARTAVDVGLHVAGAATAAGEPASLEQPPDGGVRLAG